MLASAMPHHGPMRLLRISEPFDHPEFLFEPKIDGFRALAYIDGSNSRLVSRNGHVFRSWPALATDIAASIRCRSAVLDGEICSLDSDGNSEFYRLMFRRERRPFFYAFDVLAVDGEDVTGLPLLDRKRRLRGIVPPGSSRLLYLDAVRERGTAFFRLACDRDLEGIVAKWSGGTYQCDGRRTSWLKIKNPNYSQIDGRREL